ncbi:hypothetical protein CKO44_25750 [Rubrivivax gelatinosus]|nr:hypothetical protein [Rubrivivax gelatinosus]
MGFLTPQCGHVFALVETSCLHSLHGFSAIFAPFVKALDLRRRECDGEPATMPPAQRFAT